MPNYPTDPALREALKAHRSTHGLINPQMAKLFGVTPTFISKYLNDKLDHNPENFDARAWDILKSIAGKLDLASALFETSVSRAITGRVDIARRTSDVCLIHGDAGVGKTSSALLYVDKNPSCLYVKVTGRSCSAADLESMVFQANPNKSGYKSNQKRWPFLVDAFKGSQTALFVDNAHRLDRSGRNWAFDFNEETGIAIIFLANPEILKKIQADDQQHSRIGVRGEATYRIGNSDDKKPKFSTELADVATKVAEQFSSPEFAAAIDDLAAEVAKHDGLLRSVRKNVILAYELANKNGTEPRKAFRDAHGNQGRSYKLATD